jgi:hypothetical protein
MCGNGAKCKAMKGMEGCGCEVDVGPKHGAPALSGAGRPALTSSLPTRRLLLARDRLTWSSWPKLCIFVLHLQVILHTHLTTITQEDIGRRRSRSGLPSGD